jgi:hypothetical protein
VALFIEPDTGRYNLKFDYFTIFEDVWVDDLEIKVSERERERERESD